MLAELGYALATLTGLFSLVLSARAWLVPRPAATGFGVPAVAGIEPYMAIKANRDLAVGLLILAMLATASTRALGWAMLVAATIPLLDGLIVLRSGGPKAIVFGVHHATAAIMLTTAVLLLVT